MVSKVVDSTIQAFKNHFGENPDSLFMSPGRINVIGEHIDYNDGFVLPAAIDKYVCFAIKKTDSDKGELYAVDFDDTYTVNINDDLKPVEQKWANYLLGVIDGIKKKGKKSEDITLIGQASEHNFAGVKCGIMDQFASVFGKKDKVIKLDCTTLDYTYYDAKLDDHCFVLFDSCVKHTHLTSGYNDRRNEVDSGISTIKANFSEVKSFRDVTHEMLEKLKGDLGEVIYKRCHFVIEEISRVEKAALALKNQDFKKLGELLNETHNGLSKEYEVSCQELDFLVEETIKEKGVRGARMMGGGFGGCSLNLVEKAEADNVIATIQKKYKEAFGIDMKVYQVNISEGTHQYEGNL
ncbi:hypothetical protein PIROE2DRAFT_63117 [Piromyces sp. E2]|nr:hypothetical protein PIROE2DRAFT_63117 [Piromyces sp. E2]|eukprot:OUM60481.1 hypothetical protein PIROE2DRAFT_63117 [Piromyces sp. E2]